MGAHTILRSKPERHVAVMIGFVDPVDQGRTLVRAGGILTVTGHAVLIEQRLAGLRLGWLYGPAEIVEILRRIGPTFPISNIALDCGIAAMDSGDYPEEIKQLNRSLRNELRDGMRSLGLYPLESQTNFVLIGFPEDVPDALKITEALWERKIMVRCFPNPILINYIRVSIGTEEEMALFHSAMRTCLDELC